MTARTPSGNQDYQRPVEIAPGIFWVGFYDAPEGLHCNPYLITDGDEAVLIDGGSRPDFPVVMMKILQTGCLPSQIRALIYQHYDPDLCGSISNLEEMVGRKDLQILSARANHMFIQHYAAKAELTALRDIDFRFRFTSGREILFFETPYAHSQGSTVAFDTKHRVLFSSDLFGSYSEQWELFLELSPECQTCADFDRCPNHRQRCPLQEVQKFHRLLIPSKACLDYALKQIEPLDFAMIAPQHGSIIRNAEAGRAVLKTLQRLENIGIDGVVAGTSPLCRGVS